MVQYLVIDLEENFGATYYKSQEEFIEMFSEMFDCEEDFVKVIRQMEGLYEVIEIKGDFTVGFILES